ncbi:MAG: DNA recombination protein RmuC [Gammaproteobacteria bacterium]|nr:DNA recombination protein RmuC [Gammaproteobacteria bacterium]
MRYQQSRLESSLEMEKKLAEQQQQTHETTVQDMSKTFSALSGEALKSNSESFLKLAQDKLQQFQMHAQKDLDHREKSVENLVKPIKEALDKTEKQMRQIENDRKEAYGSLTKHLETMAQTQTLLQSETRNLVQALRRPEVRGQWGEITLKRLAELAGMVEYCDFYEQEHTQTEEGVIRPDMIVRLPAGREIIVDVKTPLDAYISAIEAKDDEQREKELTRHLRNVRSRVRELASKAYWGQFKNSPDFVVLFIPGDQFLSAALERDHSLLEDALKQKVILATPTSLVALLRAIAFGWRQEALAENADKIRQLGEDLYKRLATFGEHLTKLGKNLGSSVDSFNKTVGSLERQVVPGARKLHELGIQSTKQLDSPDPIEKSVRTLEKE